MSTKLNHETLCGAGILPAKYLPHNNGKCCINLIP